MQIYKMNELKSNSKSVCTLGPQLMVQLGKAVECPEGRVCVCHFRWALREGLLTWIPAYSFALCPYLLKCKQSHHHSHKLPLPLLSQHSRLYLLKP